METRETQSLCEDGQDRASANQTSGGKKDPETGGWRRGAEHEIRFYFMAGDVILGHVISQLVWPCLVYHLPLFFHFPTVILLLWNNLKQLSSGFIRQAKSETVMYDM